MNNKHFASNHLLSLGKMTVFYIPSHKLDDARFYENKETARSVIHLFLMKHFRAYTHTPTPVKGYWTDQQDQWVHDVMERFEVSFHSDHDLCEDDFEQLIEFLVEVCVKLKEDAIYVTRGDRSYLINAVSHRS